MNDEERRLITGYVERVAGAQQPQGAWGGAGAQPARAALPPVDPDADRLLWELFNRYPEARYRVTQTAFVQEAALLEAQNRIRQLEWEVENARRQGQAMASQASAPRGVLGGMFGGGRPAVPAPQPMPPPPQPQYPAGYNPQAMQQATGRSGMGFLGTAATAAAGVAGGMILGNMLMGAFSGHGGAHASSFGGGGMGGGYGGTPVSASWGADGGAKDGGSPWGSGGDGSASGGSWSQDQDAGGGASGGSWGQPDAQPDGSGYASDNSYDSGGSSYDSGGGDWGGGGGGSDDN